MRAVRGTYVERMCTVEVRWREESQASFGTVPHARHRTRGLTFADRHAFPVSSFFAWYVAQAEEGRVEAVDLLVHMAQLFSMLSKVPVTMPVHDASARHCARHCSRVLMVFVLQAVTHSD